jgi:fatty acid desaturase
MANELQAPPDEASVASLMRGIIDDIGSLVRQEIRFARTEIREDLRKTKQAAAIVASGTILALIGAVLFALMLVYLIQWLSLPAGTTTEGLPLWGCFGIVSAVFLGIGSIVAFAGCEMFKQFNPLPEKTAQTVKENVEWITNSK